MGDREGESLAIRLRPHPCGRNFYSQGAACAITGAGLGAEHLGNCSLLRGAYKPTAPQLNYAPTMPCALPPARVVINSEAARTLLSTTQAPHLSAFCSRTLTTGRVVGLEELGTTQTSCSERKSNFMMKAE